MSEQLSDRVHIDREEYESFLAENRQLIERYRKLLDRVENLAKLNRELEQSLNAAQEELRTTQDKLRAGQEIHELIHELKADQLAIREGLQQTNKRLGNLEQILKTREELNREFREKLHIAEQRLLDNRQMLQGGRGADPERVEVSRKEWDSFLSDFSVLTQKYESILAKLDLAKTTIQGSNQGTRQQIAKSSETLRQLRRALDKLCEETEEELVESE